MEEPKRQFADLLERNKALIYKICYMYANETDTPDDLFQEVAINLWKSYPKFRGDSTIQTWIYRVSLNTCITFLRKSGKRPVTQPLTDEHAGFTDPTENSRIKQLYRLVNQLNPIEKAIILLYLDERSYEEIGQIVGLTKTNTGVRISRIKEKLAQLSNPQNRH